MAAITKIIDFMTSFKFEKLIEECGNIQKAERLAYIDFMLIYLGAINRSDLKDFFGIAEAAASKAITEYKNLRANNVEYNRVLRANSLLRDTFEPLLSVDSEVALGMLANGFNKSKLTENRLISYRRVGNSCTKVSTSDVSKVTRAIHGQYVIECVYASANSNNHKTRILFPYAIFNDGVSWRFRAYDRNKVSEKSGYKCFNFSRLDKVKERIKDLPKTSESHEKDKDWHEVVPVHLSLHPSLNNNQKFALRKDFGLVDNKNDFIQTEKAALVYFLIETWKVDTSKNPSKNNIFNFYLENSDYLAQFNSIKNIIKK